MSPPKRSVRMGEGKKCTSSSRTLPPAAVVPRTKKAPPQVLHWHLVHIVRFSFNHIFLRNSTLAHYIIVCIDDVLLIFEEEFSSAKIFEHVIEQVWDSCQWVECEIFGLPCGEQWQMGQASQTTDRTQTRRIIRDKRLKRSNHAAATWTELDCYNGEADWVQHCPTTNPLAL